MKKMTFSILVVIILSIIVIISYINLDGNRKMQIIKYDNMNNSEKIIKTIRINENSEINLEKYDGNNLKILEISEEGIKTSRVAIRYEIINQTSDGVTGETRKYKETVIEFLEYNKLVPINIDSNNPFGPSYVQLRYNYYIKFIK